MFNCSTGMETACFLSSPLELWANYGKFDKVSDRKIAELTMEDVIEKVNTVSTSGLFLIDRDFLAMFGGTKKYDDRGRLIHATGVTMELIGKMNGTLALEEGVPLGDALGELVDSYTSEFEIQLIETLQTDSYNLKKEGSRLYINIARSFSDIASNAIITDISMIVLGFCVVFTYVSIMLGKLDMVRNRV